MIESERGTCRKSKIETKINKERQTMRKKQTVKHCGEAERYRQTERHICTKKTETTRAT